MYVVVMLVRGSSVWFVRSVCSLYGVSLYYFILVLLFFLVLTIFNEGAYLTFKSIFHKALNLFQFDCDIMLEYVPGNNQY